MSRVEVPIQSWQCYDCFPEPRVRTYNLVRIQSSIQKSYRFPVPPPPQRTHHSTHCIFHFGVANTKIQTDTNKKV